MNTNQKKARVLLDHNIPAGVQKLLANHFPTLSVSTTGKLGWARLENGDLLNTAEQAGFDILVSGDQNIRHQNNLTKHKIALVNLSEIKWPVLREHPQLILDAVSAATAGSYTFVTFPLPPRRARPQPLPGNDIT